MKLVAVELESSLRGVKSEVVSAGELETIPVTIIARRSGWTCVGSGDEPGVTGTRWFRCGCAARCVVTCGFRLKGFPHDHGNQFLILVCIA